MISKHSWNVTPKQAIQIQKKLAPKIIKRGSPQHVQFIAGCDIAYDSKTKRAFAAVLVFSWPKFELAETSVAVQPVRFPYVPGLLSFREVPALLKSIRKLKLKPDLFMVDGQGIAHPRRIGLASHLGLLLGKPTIGAAKSRLIGKFTAPAKKAGSRSPLRDKNEIIGSVVRTRSNVRPIFVSVGHLIGLREAVNWTLRTCRGFRIPEPTRQADIFVEKLKNARKV